MEVRVLDQVRQRALERRPVAAHCNRARRGGVDVGVRGRGLERERVQPDLLGRRPGRFLAGEGEQVSGQRGDRAALERGLANLVENAHVHGRGRIAVAVEEADGLARLSVRDEGRGLQPYEAERAFGRFWRADGLTGGSGLGLAIVRATAERHGGRAFAEGASFTIELPVVRESSETAATTEA